MKALTKLVLAVFFLVGISNSIAQNNPSTTNNYNGWEEKPNKDVVKMENTGNVGIGVEIPQEKLHVKGNVRVEHLANNPQHPWQDFIGQNNPENVLAHLSFVLANNYGALESIPFERLALILRGAPPPNEDPVGPDNSVKQSGPFLGVPFGTFWRIDGNSDISNTVGSENFLGTTIERDLLIKTNNQLRMSIASSGLISMNENLRLEENCNILKGLTVNNNANILGNVAIGTDSPVSGYQLTVCGNIITEKVRVETWGCDFVFDRDYKLMSLPELELYIDQNKHLPLIPPAVDVEENGMDVGEMQSLLLQKVEELTLYMIDQNKRIEALEAENQSLKSKSVQDN